jgi:hypothetical protein
MAVDEFRVVRISAGSASAHVPTDGRGTAYTLSHSSSPLSNPRPTDAPAHSNRLRLLQALTSSAARGGLTVSNSKTRNRTEISVKFWCDCLLKQEHSPLECRFRAEQIEKEENDDEDCPSADARLHESPASLQSIPVAADDSRMDSEMAIFKRIMCERFKH